MKGAAYADERFDQNPFLEDRHRDLRRRLREFARGIRIEESDEGCRRIVRELGGAGFLDATSGRDLRALCVSRETLAETHGLLDFALAMQGLGSHAVELAGSDALKARVLPKVRSGEWVAAIALTEPEAGSDLPAITTTAVRSGDSWTLSGLKTLISNAPIADVMTVLARTDPAAGTKGMSLFAVLRTDGVRLEERQEVAAFHPLGKLRFDRVALPQERSVGALGEGYKLVLAVLETFRTSVGAAALGMAAGALSDALDHVQARRQFGKTLGEQPVVQSRLAEMACDVEAVRLLVYRAAARRDAGHARIPLESAMGKLMATELAQRVIDTSVQLHGGLGVLKGTPVERRYREIRALRIYEGASDILKVVIGGLLLK